MADEVLTQLEDLDLLKELEFKPGQTLTAEQLNRMLKLIELAVRNSGTTVINQIKEMFIDNPEFSSRIDNIERALERLYSVNYTEQDLSIPRTHEIAIVLDDDAPAGNLTKIEEVAQAINAALLVNGILVSPTNNDTYIIASNLEFNNPFKYTISGSATKIAGIWLWKHDEPMPDNDPSNEYLWRPVMPYAQFRAEKEYDAQYKALFDVIDAGSY